DACWSCRTKLEDIQALIREVVHVRQDLLLPSIPPPTQLWPGLQSRLDEIDAQMANASPLARLRTMWTTRALGSWRWAAISAIAATIVAEVVVRREEVVSAKELLARATEVERIEQTAASHRRLLLEARRLPGRDLTSRRRIDIWRRGDGG